MNRIKLFLIAALCVFAIGGLTKTPAQASGSKVLVAGKQTLRQADVDTIIKFYEWAFDAAFTDSDRERFQDLSVQEFRRDPAGSRKNTDILLGAFEKIQAKTADEQEKFRTAFTDSFV